VEAAESGHRPGERGEVTGAGRGKQEIVKEAGVGLSPWDSWKIEATIGQGADYSVSPHMAVVVHGTGQGRKGTPGGRHSRNGGRRDGQIGLNFVLIGAYRMGRK